MPRQVSRNQLAPLCLVLMVLASSASLVAQETEEVGEVSVEDERPVPPPEESQRTQRVFPLKHRVDPKDVVQQFERLFGDEGKWAVNVSAEGIRFFGTEEQVQAAADLIAKLDRRETKIFSLQHADATQLAALIEKLYAGPTLAVAVDERTNQIVASGLPDNLEIISAVLLSLDQPLTDPVRDAEEIGARPGDLTRPADHANTESGRIQKLISRLHEKYEAAERSARNHAQEYRRWKRGSAETDESEGLLQRQRLKLKAAVEMAFVIRQQLQLLELDQLRQQLSEIEQRVRQREKLKDRIVERRVEVLLTNADLSWAPSAATAVEAEPHDTAGQAASRDIARRAAELARLQGPVQVEAMPGTDMVVIRGDADDVRTLMNVVEKLEEELVQGSSEHEPEPRDAGPPAAADSEYGSE